MAAWGVPWAAAWDMEPHEVATYMDAFREERERVVHEDQQGLARVIAGLFGKDAGR